MTPRRTTEPICVASTDRPNVLGRPCIGSPRFQGLRPQPKRPHARSVRPRSFWNPRSSSSWKLGCRTRADRSPKSRPRWPRGSSASSSARGATPPRTCSWPRPWTRSGRSVPTIPRPRSTPRPRGSETRNGGRSFFLSSTRRRSRRKRPSASGCWPSMLGVSVRFRKRSVAPTIPATVRRGRMPRPVRRGRTPRRRGARARGVSSAQ